jgi:small subunit ribosomal protein S4
MARYTGPENKLRRRFGLLAESAPTGKREFTKRKSGYGIRLEEKQKLRFLYGVLEKQFRRYFDQARKNPSSTSFVLMSLLERRLDNVVYRLGFTKTRRAARQLVNHGNVLVNNKKVDIPSYSVNVDDVITLNDKALNMVDIQNALESEDTPSIPNWLGRKAHVGVVKSLPTEEEVRTDIDIQLIIEYYSR